MLKTHEIQRIHYLKNLKNLETEFKTQHDFEGIQKELEFVEKYKQMIEGKIKKTQGKLENNKKEI